MVIKVIQKPGDSRSAIGMLQCHEKNSLCFSKRGKVKSEVCSSQERSSNALVELVDKSTQAESAALAKDGQRVQLRLEERLDRVHPRIGDRNTCTAPLFSMHS